MSKYVILLLVSACLIIQNQCKKDDISPEPANDIQVNNGLLEFKNMDILIRQLDSLDQYSIIWNQLYLSAHDSLSEEDLNLLQEQERFDEEKPLADFENKFGFQSLRAEINAQEEAWLAGGGENTDLNPDNHFIDDPVFRTVLNAAGEIKIGKSIFIIREDAYYEIKDGSFKTLDKIRNKQINPDDNASVIVYKTLADECDSGKRKWGYEVVGTKRIKWSVSHRTYPWGRFAISRTVNYKKSGSKWKKYSAPVAAMVFGFISDESGDCSKQLNFNPSLNYASTTAKKVKHKIAVATKTKSGWVQGSHSGAGGITYNSVLTW